MTQPLKVATTVEQQIQILRCRGMEVDEALATQWLSNVSYYRLSAYWYPARLVQASGKRADDFRPGTRFTDVVHLYEVDRKLRTLVHDGIERIEVALRARLVDQLCHPDPLRYEDPDTFRPSFDHESWMKTATRRIRRSKAHSAAIQHYEKKYGQFPFWVLADVLDFADISKLFEGLSTHDQRAIAESLGVTLDLAALSAAQRSKTKTQSPLVRWMEQLTIVRNTCAHHGRLWNKSFAPAPTAALRTLSALQPLPIGQSERVFGALTIMAYLLRTVSPGSAWAQRTADLITSEFLRNPLVEPAALGLPEAWNGRL